jgi:hypothetical protein
MIKYEHNTLVLDSSHTKHDQKAVNDFIEQVARQERERVLAEIEQLEKRLDETRTPVFDQSHMFKLVRKVVAKQI